MSSSTFNLPDLRGRAPFGFNSADTNAKVTSLAANDGGAIADRSPSHHHTYTIGNVSGGSTDAAEDSNPQSHPKTSGGNLLDTPGFVTVNYIIKT